MKLEQIAATPAPGFIYFIETETGACKVGKTSVPARRLAKLASDNHEYTFIAHTIETDNMILAERYVHHLLDRYRKSGEWFRLAKSNPVVRKLFKTTFISAQDALPVLKELEPKESPPIPERKAPDGSPMISPAAFAKIHGLKMLSPRLYADQHGVAYETVIKWLRKDLIPGAERIDLPTGHVFQIPENAERPPALKPGRVPQPKPPKAPLMKRGRKPKK